MTSGRDTCNALKAIRKQIAEANEIKYEPQECTHEGECAGTCPACEAEVRYLEGELIKRKALGKKVVMAGLLKGKPGLSSCGSSRIAEPEKEPSIPTDTTQSEVRRRPPVMGKIPYPKRKNPDRT